IPVQILSVEDAPRHSIERGAFSYMPKPTSAESIGEALERIRQFTLPRIKRLLVVEDDPVEQMSIDELIRHDDVEIVAATSGQAAIEQMRSEHFDCVVLDLKLPDMSGFELL